MSTITRSISFSEESLDWLGRYNRPRSTQLQEDLAILAYRYRYLAAVNWGLTDGEMTMVQEIMGQIPVPPPGNLARMGVLMELDLEERWDGDRAQELDVGPKKLMKKIRDLHPIDVWMLWSGCWEARW